MLVDLEDESRCIGGILDDAVLSLIVEVCPIEIILVDASNTGHS